MNTVSKQLLAYIYAGSQLLILAIFIIKSKWISGNVFLDIVILFSVFLGLWSIYTVKPSRVKIRPIPHPRGEMITWGPYRYIRHPMYTAQLMLTACWMIDLSDYRMYLLWFFYLIVIEMKLEFEEKQLLMQFSGYRQYKNETWRLLPFIW